MIQIQPSYKNGQAYIDLAEKEGLTFEVLELSCGETLTEGISEKALDYYKHSGLVTSLHGAFIDIFPISPDPDIRAISIDKVRRSCELALTLDSKNIVFHTSAVHTLDGKALNGWAIKAAEFYDALAREYDLNIFIENFFDLLPIELGLLMKYSKDQRVNVCLDLGHANISHRPPASWFEELGDNVKYLHLSDNNGVYDDHVELGAGKLDFDAIGKNIVENLNEIPVTLEVKGIDSTKKAIEYLRDLQARYS